MKLQFNVSDDLFEHFVKLYGIPGCYARMRKILEEMKDVTPEDRYLVISGDGRRAIEAVFQTTLDTPQKLATLVKNMSTVKIGNIEIGFTSDELARIDAQAGFHGRTRETYITEMATELKNRMLETV